LLTPADRFSPQFDAMIAKEIVSNIKLVKAGRPHFER
jgi:hypothetical protein